jgi:hypothetical protein
VHSIDFPKSEIFVPDFFFIFYRKGFPSVRYIPSMSLHYQWVARPVIIPSVSDPLRIGAVPISVRILILAPGRDAYFYRFFAESVRIKIRKGIKSGPALVYY